MAKQQNSSSALFSSLRISIAAAVLVLAISPSLEAAPQDSTGGDAKISNFSFADFLSEVIAEIWPEESSDINDLDSIQLRSETGSEIEIEPPRPLAPPTSSSKNTTKVAR